MNSKFWTKISIVIAIVALAFSLAALGQSTAKLGPKYDLAGEVKVKGVIEDIRDTGELRGTNLAVKTDTKTILVYVGPGDFLKEIEVSFNKGDQVDVTGCKAPNTTEEILLAREITVGSNTFTLRDDKGVPIWTGWKTPKSGK